MTCRNALRQASAFSGIAILDALATLPIRVFKRLV
jgi:hypothetical protein